MATINLSTASIDDHRLLVSGIGISSCRWTSKLALVLHRILRIIDITTWRQAPGTQPAGPRLPRNWQRLELVMAGRAWAEDQTGELEAEAGCVVWDGPEERCLHRTTAAGFTAFLVTVEVAPGTLRDGPRISRWEDPLAARSAVADWNSLWRESVAPRHDLGLAVFARLRLVALRQAMNGADLPAPVRRALTVIENGFAANLGVAELATTAGCSPSRLHALFHAHLATTPHRRLLERRLQAAKEALAGPRSLSLAEVAYVSGFSTAATLCRVFRRELGMTPAAYRATVY